MYCWILSRQLGVIVLERTLHCDVDLVSAFCDHNGVLKKVQVNSNLSFILILLPCGLCFAVIY